MLDPADDWDHLSAWWAEYFTGDRDLEYAEQILPMLAAWLPQRGVGIDVGCGDGQVTRLMAERGLSAVGIDRFARQLDTAASRGGRFVQGDACSLPVRHRSIDVAVCVLVLEHVGSLDAAIGEFASAVRAGGTLLLVLNHPLLQTPGSGWIHDHVLEPPEHYWRVGEYLSEGDTIERVTESVSVRFFHRPLNRYVNALVQAGFDLEEMVEPPPPEGFLDDTVAPEIGRLIPRLMLLRWRRR